MSKTVFMYVYEIEYKDTSLRTGELKTTHVVAETIVDASSCLDEGHAGMENGEFEITKITQQQTVWVRPYEGWGWVPDHEKEAIAS